MLLDVLSEEEIKSLFLSYSYQLYNNEVKAIISDEVDESDSEDSSVKTNDNILAMKQKNVEAEEAEIVDNKETADTVIGEKSDEDKKDAAILQRLIGTPDKVVFGCTVIVKRKRDEKVLEYIIPKDENGKWFPIEKMLLGKVVNETIYFAPDEYVVIEIKW